MLIIIDHVYSEQFCISHAVVHLCITTTLKSQISSFIGAIDFPKHLSTEKLPLAHKNKSEIIIEAA